MDNGSAEDGEDENEDVYTRYVEVVVSLLGKGGPNFIAIFLESGYRALRWPWASREATQEHRYAFSHVLVPAPLLRGGLKQNNSFT